MKNGVPIEGPLPESLASYLDRYVNHHRARLLLGQTHSALWVRQGGLPYSVNSLSQRFEKITTRLGYPMRCHDVRRSAATTIAEVRPDLSRDIGHMLAHKGQHTSERHYNKAQMRLSSRRHAEVIDSLKQHLVEADDAFT